MGEWCGIQVESKFKFVAMHAAKPSGWHCICVAIYLSCYAVFCSLLARENRNGTMAGKKMQVMVR